MTTGYLAFPDLKSAQDRSHAEALARGCKAGDVTQWWWAAVVNPLVPGQGLILLDDGRAAYAKTPLSTGEKAAVLTDPATLAAL